MTISWHRFVRHQQVPAYERQGWIVSDALRGTHHGDWSTLMHWTKSGKPPEIISLDLVGDPARNYAAAHAEDVE